MPKKGRKEPAPEAQLLEGRGRAVVDAILPVIDGGRFRAKCIAGEPAQITAHCFTDGMTGSRVVLRWQASMRRTPMKSR